MQNIFIISAGSFTMNGLPVKCLSIIFWATLNLLFTNLAHACWEDAAQKYGIQPQLLYAIAKTESGFNPNAMNQNKNGSFDIGLMQINSSWLPKLRQYGIGVNELFDPCTSIQVGAWILAQNIQRLGHSWEAVGAYNSSIPAYRQKYAEKVYKNLPILQRIGQ